VWYNTPGGESRIVKGRALSILMLLVIGLPSCGPRAAATASTGAAATALPPPRQESEASLEETLLRRRSESETEVEAEIEASRLLLRRPLSASGLASTLVMAGTYVNAPLVMSSIWLRLLVLT